MDNLLEYLFQIPETILACLMIYDFIKKMKPFYKNIKIEHLIFNISYIKNTWLIPSV